MLTTEKKTKAVIAALEDIKANDITVIATRLFRELLTAHHLVRPG